MKNNYVSLNNSDIGKKNKKQKKKIGKKIWQQVNNVGVVNGFLFGINGREYNSHFILDLKALGHLAY